MIDEFRSHTNWSNDTSVAKDLFVIEQGLYYTSNFNGSLKFSLNGGFEVEVPAEELVWPVRGLDVTGKKVLQDNLTVVNILSDHTPEGTATLGKVFLSGVCLTLNSVDSRSA